MMNRIAVLGVFAVLFAIGCGNSDEGEPTGNKENPNMEFSTQGADTTGGSATSQTESAASDQ